MRPSEEMVKKAYETNDAGAGIAYRENGTVVWKKGLDLAGITELVASAPFPFISHFRIPTSGGKRNTLCHPFPIDVEAPLDLEGSTKGFVLFHNGHWTRWKEIMERIALNILPAKIPGGRWSDSRAMAWAAAYMGINYLDLIDEKAVAFGPTELEIFHNDGWTKVDDVWASNSHFQFKRNGGVTYSGYMGSSEYARNMCKNIRCTRRDIDKEGWCPDHRETVLPPKKESGGTLNTLPFVLASKMFREGKLSKNKWKKSRKQHEKAMWKATREATITH